MASTIKLRCLDNNGNNIFYVDSLSGIWSANTQPSVNATTGALVLYGGITINNTTNSVSAQRGGALTVVGGTGIGGDVYIGGSLSCNNINISNATFNKMVVTNTTDASSNTTGSIVSTGGLSIKTSSNANSVTSGGALLVQGGAAFGRDVYIGGNLTVLGTQTNVISQIVNMTDNLLLLNYNTNATKDTGLLYQRYQVENDNNIGDVVSDTPILTGTIVSTTTNTAVLSTNVSVSDVTNWYIKITSGSGINQVRLISAYNSLSRTITVNTQWSVQPSSGDTFSLYNNPFISHFFSEGSKEYIFAYTTTSTGSTSVNVTDYLPVKAGKLSITSTTDASGIGTGGSLTVLGGAAISKTLISNNFVSTSTTTSSLLVGTLNIYNTSNATGLGTGGSVNVSGGISVLKDVYIGGNLYISGQNISIISGTATIGSYSGTGAYTLSGISIGKTMSNTSYKITANTSTVSNVSNVYAVTLKNLTTTTFDAVVFRLDALASGWTDDNLQLSWHIIS